MQSAKQLWLRGGFVGVCLLAGLLTGCSDSPKVRQQKYMESGQRYYDKGQYREAAIQFQNAIQVDSHSADAHFKMAMTAMKLEQWPGAMQEFSAAVQANPEHYPARLEMAKLLMMGGQFPSAKEQLDFLAQKQPSNPDVFIALANYYSGTGNTGAALAALQRKYPDA